MAQQRDLTECAIVLLIGLLSWLAIVVFFCGEGLCIGPDINSRSNTTPNLKRVAYTSICVSHPYRHCNI